MGNKIFTIDEDRLYEGIPNFRLISFEKTSFRQRKKRTQTKMFVHFRENCLPVVQNRIFSQTFSTTHFREILTLFY